MEAEALRIPEFKRYLLKGQRVTTLKGRHVIALPSDNDILCVFMQRDDRDNIEPWPLSYIIGLVHPHLAEE